MSDATISYATIICPVDFSPCSRRAFYKAVGYAKLFNAKLYVLHVVERNLSVGSYEQVEEESTEMDRLEAGLVRRLDELESEGQVSQQERERISLEFRGGKPYLEILRFAQEVNANLIVMGTHGHTGIKHIIIGSQAERVVRRSHCDVVCVKPEAYEPHIDV